jgi:type IV secretory pathway VirJ component
VQREWLALVVLAGLALTAPPAFAQAAPSGSLPLVRVEAPPGTDGPMVLLLSGDGNWAAFDRAFSAAAASTGSPVLGLESRSYLSRPRTPEEASAALARAVRAQLATWDRRNLIVVGYSRGADMAPFVVSGWPASLRTRVLAIAFIGLSERASFEFHLEDLFRDVARPTDLPTRPEIAKLSGIPMLCVYGETEQDSFCAKPVQGMRSIVHAGGHRVGDDRALIALLLRDLGLAPAPGAQTGGETPKGRAEPTEQ